MNEKALSELLLSPEAALLLGAALATGYRHRIGSKAEKDINEIVQSQTDAERERITKKVLKLAPKEVQVIRTPSDVDKWVKNNESPLYSKLVAAELKYRLKHHRPGGLAAGAISPKDPSGQWAVLIPKGAHPAITGHELGHAKDLKGTNPDSILSRLRHLTEFALPAQLAEEYNREERAWDEAGRYSKPVSKSQIDKLRDAALGTYRAGMNAPRMAFIPPVLAMLAASIVKKASDKVVMRLEELEELEKQAAFLSILGKKAAKGAEEIGAKEMLGHVSEHVGQVGTKDLGDLALVALKKKQPKVATELMRLVRGAKSGDIDANQILAIMKGKKGVQVAYTHPTSNPIEIGWGKKGVSGVRSKNRYLFRPNTTLSGNQGLGKLAVTFREPKIS